VKQDQRLQFSNFWLSNFNNVSVKVMSHVFMALVNIASRRMSQMKHWLPKWQIGNFYAKF